MDNRLTYNQWYEAFQARHLLSDRPDISAEEFSGLATAAQEEWYSPLLEEADSTESAASRLPWALREQTYSGASRTVVLADARRVLGLEATIGGQARPVPRLDTDRRATAALDPFSVPSDRWPAYVEVPVPEGRGLEIRSASMPSAWRCWFLAQLPAVDLAFSGNEKPPYPRHAQDQILEIVLRKSAATGGDTQAYQMQAQEKILNPN